MTNYRKPTTLALSILATGALLGGTAAAQTAEGDARTGSSGYHASANAESLRISLFGQDLTASRASALVQESPRTAKGTAGQVLVGPLFTGEAVAETTTDGTVTKDNEPCAISQLEAVPGLRQLDLTCGSASATLGADGGSARGVGAGVVLAPSVSGLLGTLQLQEPVQGVVGQVYEQVINPLVEALTGNPVGDLVKAGTDTVQDVLNDVLSLESTVRVVIAPALAEVDVNADTVSAKAHGQGIRIELLPVDGAGATNGLLPDDLLPGEPLITITIGDAKVSKSVPRAGGTPTTTSSASVVTVELGTNALTAALGLDQQAIRLEANQSLCLLQGTPLETCINVASAGVDANGDPFAGATSVELLKGVSGGIGIVSGSATAGGEAGGGEVARALPASAPAAATAPATELPKTGGPAVLPVIGTALLGLGALGRRLTRRS